MSVLREFTDPTEPANRHTMKAAASFSFVSLKRRAVYDSQNTISTTCTVVKV